MNRGGSDEGDNLSSGERQLVSLVQGLLGPSVGDGSRCASAQVYLFDEITASVDYAADEAVNEVILSLPATVIAIMHRLHHLPKFDQVVVMSEGRVLEVGTPVDLIADRESELYKLCASQGVSF